MKMTQKEAVYTSVVNVLTEAGVELEGTLNEHFAPGAPKAKEYRGQVNNMLFEGFKSGTIGFDGAVPEDAKLKAYVSGLQSNWLRKDKRLNGGVKYEAKNPGSRTGSTDSTLKNMRLLLATVTDAADKAEIQTAIDARVAELKPAKTTAVLDVGALPESLRKFAK